MERTWLFQLFLITSTCVFVSDAEVKMPAIFSDNMVLQQNCNVTIWGWAQPQEIIAIQTGWGEMASAITDADSRWSTKVRTAQAGGPYDIVVKGNDSEYSFTNVMLGEVWICSGQSNMQMPMNGWPNQPVLGGPQAIAHANVPDIRLFTVKRNSAKTAQENCEGAWVVCSPQTVPDFSAVGYFFGRKLYDELKVPVGLIHSSWGGSTAEAWIQRDILCNDPEFEPMVFRFNSMVAKWESDTIQAKANNTEAPKAPAPQHSISYLYNGMIKPLIPYTIKGVIWYQGESNANRSYQYGKLFPKLIQNWRQDWGYEMPFYYVQLASYVKHKPTEEVTFDNSIPTESYWAELREAQLETLKSTQKTGMAVAIDIGKANNIHPDEKKAVGQRLAFWALVKDYGKQMPYSGPLYKSMTIEKGKRTLFGLKKLPYSGKKIIRIKYDHADGGLMIKGDELISIAIAGADRFFIWADAAIENDELVVWSDKVDDPVAVRYGWSTYPECNLYNKAGLPASPFRTDKWFSLPNSQKP